MSNRASVSALLGLVGPLQVCKRKLFTYRLVRENPATLLPNIDTRRPGVETFVAHSSSKMDIAGYDYPVSYASDPKNDYQARLRRSNRVGHHYTPVFSDLVVER